MAFAQLTYRESLRDIQACLRDCQQKIYHMGLRGKVSRNTLTHANQIRDWHIYADFAQILSLKPATLYPQIFRYRAGSNYLCTRYYHHRSLSFSFSLGKISSSQRGYQASYPYRFARQHSHTHFHYSRQSSRDQSPRRTPLRTWRHLPFRSWLFGLCTPLQNPPLSGFLYHPRQTQLPFSPPILPASVQIQRNSSRSNHPTPWVLFPQRLSRPTPAHSLLRFLETKKTGFSNQQLHPANFTITELYQYRWKSSSSSNGSSNISASKLFMALPKMQ